MLQILTYNKNGPACRQAGGLTVEILVVIAIIVLAFASLFSLISFSLDASHLSGQNITAGVLAQEEMEALRNFRDGTSWNADGLGILTPSVSYHVEKTADNPPKWQMVLGEETFDNFTRKIIFSDVNRDANGNIVASGGVIDPETKKAVISVLWTEKNRPHQISVSAYFTNWNGR
ncbi:MAG: hypothetical protein A3A08_01530 [Candidatus Nealsonbacteria bacterium RIFCSPLOWO2_01_FULL_41_9]|uniref:Type 4 fimbrial biogenesis protein PilX N-terminal domain-containing protein n=1 Tax=Candidatus Nealsonbacteria bacterium RIFCSPLOWO2_01_FULL_41_9 TaxID=1801671 RepID=A0A1G2E9L0_9BACT|nr:MAG: hypothetical protein A3A08_01530 [Candidatus Nealsonbacteria bacterium RIFCSPLOWO2_01_FULL_41_9]